MVLTVQSTHYTVQSTQYILHNTQCTLHSTHYKLHSTQYRASGIPVFTRCAIQEMGSWGDGELARWGFRRCKSIEHERRCEAAYEWLVYVNFQFCLFLELWISLHKNITQYTPGYTTRLSPHTRTLNPVHTSHAPAPHTRTCKERESRYKQTNFNVHLTQAS